MFHIVFHNVQRFEISIKHNDKHIVNLALVINFQKLQKRFDQLNNFNLQVILKYEDLNIKSIKNISSFSHFSFQGQCQINKHNASIR